MAVIAVPTRCAGVGLPAAISGSCSCCSCPRIRAGLKGAWQLVIKALQRKGEMCLLRKAAREKGRGWVPHWDGAGLWCVPELFAVLLCKGEPSASRCCAVGLGAAGAAQRELRSVTRCWAGPRRTLWALFLARPGRFYLHELLAALLLWDAGGLSTALPSWPCWRGPRGSPVPSAGGSAAVPLGSA